MRVLALITARGGSKGLPGKNVRSFHGHPLVAWSVSQALGSKLVETVVLSTDDSEIAQAGKSYGVQVPFERPAHLSGDEAGSVDVAIHALDELEKNNQHFDVLVLLQPTSPIRKRSDIDGMLNLLKENWDHADGVVTIAPMKPSPLHSLVVEDKFVRLGSDFKALPRQALPKFYASYGVCWAIKTETLKKEKTFHPARLLPWNILREQAVDIDDLGDFVCAEALQSLLQANDDQFIPSFKKKNI